MFSGRHLLKNNSFYQPSKKGNLKLDCRYLVRGEQRQHFCCLIPSENIYSINPTIEKTWLVGVVADENMFNT